MPKQFAKKQLVTMANKNYHYNSIIFMQSSLQSSLQLSLDVFTFSYNHDCLTFVAWVFVWNIMLILFCLFFQFVVIFLQPYMMISINQSCKCEMIKFDKFLVISNRFQTVFYSVTLLERNARLFLHCI